MARPIFYHQTVKNLIVAFGSIFDEVSFISEQNETVRVPISYAPKSKFVEFYNSEPSFDTYDSKFTLPRMAFELTGMNFAPERYNNPLGRITSDNSTKFMYARVPYDFSFSLYLATKSFEESLKIVEQIIPYFTPELTVTINDQVDLSLKTDVPVVLNSVGFNIDYEGSFESKRTIEWTLGFTVKSYMYSHVKTSDLIKETIVNMQQEDVDRKFSQLISVVNPRTADKDDPHVVIETINQDPNTWKIP